jgi:RNA methyltransferase, TrmH family
MMRFMGSSDSSKAVAQGRRGHGSAPSAQDQLRRVEGKNNALVKDLRMAFAHAELTASGDCAIEGLRIVEEAIRSGLRFHAAVFSESGVERSKRLLPQIGAHVEKIVLPDKLFASIVPSDTPQGVAGLVRLRKFSLEDVLERAQFGPLIAVAGVQDPGNLGTILRSAEAFGAGGVLLGEGTVSPYNSKVVRGAAGSLFRVAIARVKIGEALEKMKEKRIRVLATSSHKGVLLPLADLRAPLALIIGGEGSGVPRDLLQRVDGVVEIPHATQVESLNAGVAASIVLYEVARQQSALSDQHSAEP